MCLHNRALDQQVNESNICRIQGMHIICRVDWMQSEQMGSLTNIFSQPSTPQLTDSISYCESDSN